MRPDSYGLQCGAIMCGGRIHSGEVKVAPARTLEGGRSVIPPGGSFCAETCAACVREDAASLHGFIPQSFTLSCPSEIGGMQGYAVHGGQAARTMRTGAYGDAECTRGGTGYARGSGTRCLSYTRLLAVCGEDAGGETCRSLRAQGQRRNVGARPPTRFSDERKASEEGKRKIRTRSPILGTLIRRRAQMFQVYIRSPGTVTIRSMDLVQYLIWTLQNFLHENRCVNAIRSCHRATLNCDLDHCTVLLF
ncbi:hypothetical protein C8R44DRAFT_747002 [Mycena epipterygia]|nr:hypothetical protein C8R44DRAFT_747002 [Mycena epipterygia]